MLLSELTAQAMKIALDAHDGQLDRGGKPYILHPMFLAEQFDDEVLVAAALLHDVLEDSSWAAAELAQQQIPQAVIDLVLVLTRRKEEKYFDYIERISHNKAAVQIKLADLRHNTDLSRLQVITEQDLSRQRRYMKAIHILSDGTDPQI